MKKKAMARDGAIACDIEKMAASIPIEVRALEKGSGVFYRGRLVLTAKKKAWADQYAEANKMSLGRVFSSSPEEV
ncbi:MAG: hypothetical protein QMC81_02825 [Thermoanaerobacterales bacterium]|nr:hypothetical protein [Thermoanaerobacterales bacterium]